MTSYLNRNGTRFVLASIAVNAVIAIVAIVSGDFSALDAKILVTSLSVTGGAVLALANLAARSDRFLDHVPEIGAAFSVIGFVLLVYGVWDEFASENIGKAAGTCILIGVGTAHGGLLSLSSLAPRYLPVLRAAWVFAAVLIGMIIMLIWFTDAVDNDIYPRVMGVVVVLLAAVTLAVPVLHRASRTELAAEAEGQRFADNAVHFCPNCGSEEISEWDGVSGCSACGVRFTVTFPV